MIGEAPVPRGFVAEGSRDLGRAHVEIGPVEEVIGAFGDGGLEDREKAQGFLIPVWLGADGGCGVVEPSVFTSREVDVIKGTLDEAFWETAFRRVNVEQAMPIPIAEAGQVVLDQGEADLMVELQVIVVGDGFAFELHGVGDRAGAPESIEDGIEFQIACGVDDVPCELAFASLIPRGRE